MMTLDLPVVNAMLNRLPNPNTSVAALRVAFSLALVYEASHIAMIDVSTALSADQRTFYMLRRFYIVMAGVLLVASVVVFSPLYDLIVVDLMNIPTEVAQAARPALVVFLLWPLPIGWRRLLPGRAHPPRALQTGGRRRAGAPHIAPGGTGLLRLVGHERGAYRACCYRGARYTGQRDR